LRWNWLPTFLLGLGIAYLGVFGSAGLAGIVPGLNISITSGLASVINSISGNVNWANPDYQVQHTGLILGKVSLPNYDVSSQLGTIRAATLDQADGLALPDLSSLLSNFPQVDSLPMTTQGYWNVYDRFAYNLYNWGSARWSKSAALSTMQGFLKTSGQSAVGLEYPPSSGIQVPPRYYDEFMETSDILLALGDLASAEQVWSWDYSAHWTGQFWGYGSPAYVECEAGPFAMLAAKLYVASGKTLQYFDTVTKDLGYKFLDNGWASPLWGGAYVCTHAGNAADCRMGSTQDSWAALQMYASLLSSTDKQNMINMLTGNGGTPAWQHLIQSPLFNNGQFILETAGTGAAPSDTATAIGLKTLFLQGIVPGTGSLAIPLLEESYEDTETMFPAQQFHFDYAGHSIRIPVNAGTLQFLFGTTETAPVSFPSSGVYTVQFSSDWNTVIGTTLIGGFSFPTLVSGSTILPPTQTGNIRVSGTFGGSPANFEAWIDSQAHQQVSGSTLFTGVSMGSHMVYALYSGSQYSQSVSLSSSGQTVTATFNFGSSSPGPSPSSSPSPGPSSTPSPSGPPPSPNVPSINIDFGAIWNTFVKNVEALIGASRQLLLVVGGFMALISGVMLIMPSKRPRIPWG
jgi:hypothetical protein